MSPKIGAGMNIAVGFVRGVGHQWVERVLRVSFPSFLVSFGRLVSFEQSRNIKTVSFRVYFPLALGARSGEGGFAEQWRKPVFEDWPGLQANLGGVAKLPREEAGILNGRFVRGNR